MKKRLLLKLGLIVLLGAGLLVAWLWWTEPGSGVCRYTTNQIKAGMTLEEVTTLIGIPSTIPRNVWADIKDAPKETRFYRVWQSGDRAIAVGFDKSGHVTAAHYFSDSLIERGRRYFD